MPLFLAAKKGAVLNRIHCIRMPEIAVFVGWVERSDTHQLSEHDDGHRVAPPILRAASECW